MDLTRFFSHFVPSRFLGGAVLCLVLLGSGCQSVQDLSLKKISDNTYQVTASDETDQDANANALALATRFCQGLGLQSQTVSGESSMVQSVHTFLLTFHCV